MEGNGLWMGKYVWTEYVNIAGPWRLLLDQEHLATGPLVSRTILDPSHCH